MKRTAEDVLAIGQDLLAVKARLAHGQFLAWLQAEFEMSSETALNYMQVARRFSGKTVNFTDSVSVLYELAAPSTPDDLIEQVTSGQLPASLPAIREAKAARRQAETEEEQAPAPAEASPPAARVASHAAVTAMFPPGCRACPLCVITQFSRVWLSL